MFYCLHSCSWGRFPLKQLSWSQEAGWDVFISSQPSHKNGAEGGSISFVIFVSFDSVYVYFLSVFIPAGFGFLKTQKTQLESKPPWWVFYRTTLLQLQGVKMITSDTLLLLFISVREAEGVAITSDWTKQNWSCKRLESCGWPHLIRDQNFRTVWVFLGFYY